MQQWRDHWVNYVDEEEVLRDCTCFEDLAYTMDGVPDGTPDEHCKVHAKA